MEHYANNEFGEREKQRKVIHSLSKEIHGANIGYLIYNIYAENMLCLRLNPNFSQKLINKASSM